VFSIDSWVWKVVVIGAIVATREFVRLLTAPERVVDERAEANRGSAENAYASYSVGTQGFVEILDSAAIAFGLVFFVIQPFLLQAFYIPSGSMEDTLQHRPSGDRLLVSKWVYRLRDPRPGDVVVFAPPTTARARLGDEYIKRCIGVPGDVVYVQKSSLFSQSARRTRILGNTRALC
jgi:hypothetical protein